MVGIAGGAVQLGAGGIWPWLWFADMRVGTESDCREMGLPLVALGGVDGNAMLARAVVGWRERGRERGMGVFLFFLFFFAALERARARGISDCGDGPTNTRVAYGHVTMVVRHLAMEEHCWARMVYAVN
ncbi:hypothetical protein J3F84DRAFT_372796 [Trichoderma pleuroticola]